MTMYNRLRIHIAALFVVSMLLPAAALVQQGCAKAPPTLSPAGRAAFQAQQAVRVLDVIRDFAVAANDQTPPVIARNDMRRVVEVHAQIVRTIRAVPDGWKPVALTALDQLKADVSAASWQRLQPYIALLKVVIQEAP